MLTILGIPVDVQLAGAVAMLIGVSKRFLGDPKGANYADLVRGAALALGTLLALGRYLVGTPHLTGPAALTAAETGFVAGAGSIFLYHLLSGDVASIFSQITGNGGSDTPQPATTATVEVGKITDVPPADPNAPKP